MRTIPLSAAFSRFLYAEGEEPKYLKEVYGIDISPDFGVNIGKLFREDIRFEDSKTNWGVQIADLLASGVRRCLRGGFRNNDLAAKLIGRLTLENEKGKAPIKLIGFSEEKVGQGTKAWDAIKYINQNTRLILKR